MNKTLRTVLLVLGGLFLLFAGYTAYLFATTKNHSPEQTLNLNEGDLAITVFYNRPYKKDREIFGTLVPYGEVWRTGANEATTFETNQNLTIGGQTLAAGKYTLWTIPQADEWEVIFNEKMYDWGVGFGAKASREADGDVLNLKAAVKATASTVEQFTITLEKNPMMMILAWDNTRIEVPMAIEGATMMEASTDMEHDSTMVDSMPQ